MRSILKNKTIISWALYDWANSAFVTVMVTACLPIYFTEVSTAGLSEDRSSIATALWSLVASISMAMIAVGALLLGPVADATARKKRYLGVFVALGAALVRRFRGRAEEDRKPVSDLLTKFREMESRGHLSDAEYRTIKTVLAPAPTDASVKATSTAPMMAHKRHIIKL